MIENHSEEKDTYWLRQQQIFDRLYQTGITEYVKTLPHLEWAFTDPDRTIRCIDERTPGGIHLAGSGILLPKDELEEVVERLKKAKVDGVWSHAECGAAELSAKEIGLSPQSSDEHSKIWARQFSDKLGVPYYGHIEPAQFTGPSGFHIARATYYIGTPSFNPARVQGFPPGFMINRAYLSKNYAGIEANLSIAIATGEHGFGQRITKENPFIVIAIADPNNSDVSIDKLRAELAPIQQASEGRVIVDGFIAPSNVE